MEYIFQCYVSAEAFIYHATLKFFLYNYLFMFQATLKQLFFNN